MATFQKFNAFTEALTDAKHSFKVHTLKFMLTNSAPSATNSVKADITEISAGNGYTAGGIASTVISSEQTGGIYKLVVTDVVWTASGNMANFRYVVLYNDSATNKDLIGWYDKGSVVNLQNGETFTIDADQTAGTITIQ